MLNNCTPISFDRVNLPAPPLPVRKSISEMLKEVPGGFGQDTACFGTKAPARPVIVQAPPKPQGNNAFGGWLSAVGGAVVGAIAGLVGGVAAGIGSVFGWGKPKQPELAREIPGAVVAPPAPSKPAERTALDDLIDEAFAWRDADANGKLEGSELAGSAGIKDPLMNLDFDEVNVGSLDREAFRREVKANESRIRQQQAEDLTRAKGQIGRAFFDVYGYTMPEGQGSKWYMDMYKGGKSVEEIKAWMIDNKAYILKARGGRLG